MNKEVVAKNLISLRKKNNLTQRELSLKLNYSDKVISKWERGESLPDIMVLNSIAKFYNVKVDDIVNLTLNEDSKENVAVIVKKTNSPSKILMWSLLAAMLFTLSTPFWAEIEVVFLVLVGYLVYVISIAAPLSHYEWDAEYKGSKIHIRNIVSKTQLWIDDRLVDEDSKLFTTGVKLTGRIREENIKVVISNHFTAKCKIIID